MSRKILRALVALAVLAALVSVAWLALRPRPVEVQVGRVERGRVESIVSNTRAGTIEACRRAKLAPQTGGQVERLPVDEGDRVEKGQVLLEIWNDDLQGQLRLAGREADAARARAEEACLSADLAERDARRTESLFESGVVGASVLDRAQADRERTRAACAAARATAEEARQRVAVAAAALEKTVLRAPFAGIVAEVNAEVGEVVTPSPPGIPTPAAIDLIDDSCLKVVAPMDEVDAPRIRVGMPARVSLDAYPGRSFSGRVSRVAPFVFDLERQSRTLEVEVVLDGEAAAGLLPGYSADVEVLLEARDDVLRVPTQAVVEGRRVLVLSDGVLVERDVELGVTNWDFSEVVSGLEPDDAIVLSLDRAGVKAGALARNEAAPGSAP